MDRLTPEKRSWNMSRIRGKNTAPEMLVRKYLYSKGVRYRIHTKLPGKPDIVVGKAKTAIFVNGCFWHCHEGCIDFRLPKTKAEFWKAKLEGNVARDQRNYNALEELGFKVVVVWECWLKTGVRDEALTRIYNDLMEQQNLLAVSS